MMRAELNQKILDAHERHNLSALVQLYTQAGKQFEEAGDIDAACFYYTHAHVFAIEVGSADAQKLHEVLVRHGRNFE